MAFKEYKRQLREALDDDFLRQTLDRFAIAYRAGRAQIFADINEKELITEIAAAKDRALDRLEELYLQFKAEAEKKGVTVHRAADAAEANEIIIGIARGSGCRKIIKAKSMTAEEIGLNPALNEAGLAVAETDLGEWIIQLRGEGPTHMVMPAIHLSRGQVGDLFAGVTGEERTEDIGRLVKVARRQLRRVFAEADLGLTGANFAIAENGTVGICTNEGNGRLVTTLPRVRVALAGLDKLVPTVEEALKIIKVLPRNATGQAITSYVTWMAGAVGGQETHIVFLDNGRSRLARDPVCGQALRCVRCGACANVCPVYRLVGGHRMGHIYIGAIGLILTYFYHDREAARDLAGNCIGCGACREVCAAGIDLPAVIQEIRARLVEEEGGGWTSSLLSRVLSDRKLFHRLLKLAAKVQRPVTGGTPYVRHLPHIFAPGQGFRALPALAARPFRELWPRLAPTAAEGTGPRVALFAGCAQDFIYPEQLEAAVKLLAAKGCRVEFPEGQGCCGLPVQMMGQRAAAQESAWANVAAFAARRCDHIVTLCASCASHLLGDYPQLIGGEPERVEALAAFTGRVVDFSSFLVNVLGYSAADFNSPGDMVAYHSPCHLCRGLGVTDEPRRLIAAAGHYLPTEEEDVCCGFGGTYSLKFPEISAELLAKKLDRLEASGAGTLVTDCPGCVMQLRGGQEKRGGRACVRHLAELLADRLKNSGGGAE